MSMGTVLLHEGNFYSHYPQTQVTKLFVSMKQMGSCSHPLIWMCVYIYIYIYFFFF